MRDLHTIAVVVVFSLFRRSGFRLDMSLIDNEPAPARIPAHLYPLYLTSIFMWVVGCGVGWCSSLQNKQGFDQYSGVNKLAFCTLPRKFYQRVFPDLTKALHTL